MKNFIRVLATTIFVQLSSGAFAGLDWSKGTLTNADNLGRNANAVAYSTNGTVYVTGYEKNTSGNQLIITKKYSATGVLLNTATNSYVVAGGTIVSDFPVSITLDGAGNVYVLGSQYGGSTRGQDIVVIKYNASLSQQWKKLIYNSTSTVANFDDIPSKLLLDANNDVYIAGTWSKPSLYGTKEIMVRKYNSSGTLQFTTVISQVSGKTIEDASDMGIDNTQNLVVCAKTVNTSGVASIMYSRISNTGSLSWKKFYAAPSKYTFTGNPEVECAAGGIFYLSHTMYRTLNNQQGRIITLKFNSSAVLQWDVRTVEVNQQPATVSLHQDPNGDLYAGSVFMGQNGLISNFLRIYKISSGGTLGWNYLSTEPCFMPVIVTNNTPWLFTAFLDPGTSIYKLKKIDSSTGTVLWTEDQTITHVSGYSNESIYRINSLAINSVTSEVAYCGQLRGTKAGNNEYRWFIRKYGATTPRLQQAEVNEQPAFEMDVKLYPNPATDAIHISCKSQSDHTAISLLDVNGKLIRQNAISAGEIYEVIPVNDLPNGIYFVNVRSGEKMLTKKIVIGR